MSIVKVVAIVALSLALALFCIGFAIFFLWLGCQYINPFDPARMISAWLFAVFSIVDLWAPWALLNMKMKV